MPEPGMVSAAELSRLAGVTRATVSNWRRRHDDFPKAVGGSDARPLFDLAEVQAWLSGHGITPAVSPVAELRTLIRADATPEDVAHLMRALRRADAGWVAGKSEAVPVDFARRAVTLLDQVRRSAGPRAAVDALAERAMEDKPTTGVYPTPERLAALMAELACGPAAGIRSVLDPACGGGGLLTAAASRGAVELYGQDVTPVQVERARLAVTAETGLDPDIRLGDSLQADSFPELQVDAVLTNPPYGDRDWGVTGLAFDTRWEFGLPPRLESELAWVQHAVAHLRPGGTAVVLLPPAVASRPSGRRIRTNLVRFGVLRAVIGLAPGAAPPRHVGLQIWVLRRPEPDARAADTMLFVDTTRLPAGSGEDRIAWDVVTESVAGAWRAFDKGQDPAEVSTAAAAVSCIDVLDDAVDLTPALYVHAPVDSDGVADRVDAAVARLGAAEEEFAAARAELAGWTETRGKTWRRVTVADLAKHGQLEWIRAHPPADTPATGGDRKVLTAADVATGRAASATTSSANPGDRVAIELGDVLIPAVRGEHGNGRNIRVAGPEDAGAVRGPHLHTLRVDRELLDPWFLAGFLSGADGVSATRTSTVRFDPSRLRIPVVSASEQQQYGILFRRFFQLRLAVLRAASAADALADQVFTGLTTGVLVPLDEE
ncbi:N-6 DNA methylase [Nocardia fusca]|uniref:N-6 DNA methylase n=1 Tax=Nocardia fusca TaxID=941183 RepID=UPI0007A73B6E|nr:N-6 DNA methylase [Nocardia fusca]